MKRPLVILFSAFVLLVAGLTLFSKRAPESEASLAKSAAESSSTPKYTAPTGGTAPSPPIPDSKVIPANNPQIVGRKPYDTGIKNDQRVQTNALGKHVLIEGKQIASDLNSPNTSAEQDLETIEQLLVLYRLSHQENPVAGDNQMVMEALLGNNPKNIVIFPEVHPALDATGQLLDRWDTPYFFHALSGQEMEIFSAGPDKIFNTSDDVQLSNRNGNPLTGIVENSDGEQISE